MEMAFKKVYPNYNWTNWTIHENLHWTESSLYDVISDSYSDKSINKLADEFFHHIKPNIDATFSKIKDYQSLNAVYNSNPNVFNDYLPHSRLEKRVINGLILVKNTEPEKYEIVKDQYLNLLDKYKGNDLEEIRTEVEIGLNFLDENELKLKNTVKNT